MPPPYMSLIYCSHMPWLFFRQAPLYLRTLWCYVSVFFLNYTYFTLPCRGLGLVGLAPLPGGLTNYCRSVLDTVGWVIWSIKIVPDMTYNVFGGTLNPTLLLFFRHGCSYIRAMLSWHRVLLTYSPTYLLTYLLTNSLYLLTLPTALRCRSPVQTRAISTQNLPGNQRDLHQSATSI